jgi:hypothetical protein
MYVPGKRIVSMRQFERVVGAGSGTSSTGKYIIYRGKPVHPGWMISMQYEHIRREIGNGVMFEARINPVWKNKQRARAAVYMQWPSSVQKRMLQNIANTCKVPYNFICEKG